MGLQGECVVRPQEDIALRLPWPDACRDTLGEDELLEQHLNASRKSVYGAITSTVEDLINRYKIPAADIETARDRLHQCYVKDDSPADLYCSPAAVVAYLQKYTPRYADAFLLTLLQLAHCGLIPFRPRILDLGAGCGTNSLALIAFLRSVRAMRASNSRLTPSEVVADLTSVDRAHLLLKVNSSLTKHALREAPEVKLRHTFVRLDLRNDAGLGVLNKRLGSFDVVVLSNVMCELPQLDRTAVLRRVADLVTTEGTVVIIDPAQAGPKFAGVRRACFAASAVGLNVYGPCFGDCVGSHDCWAYMRVPTTSLDGTAEEVRYSVCVLRRDGLFRSQRPKQLPAVRLNVPMKLDLQVLVIADVAKHDSYKVCVGKDVERGREIWLRKRTELGELKTGWVYRLVSDNAVWSIKSSPAEHYELDLGEGGKAEPCPCSRRTVGPGLRVDHETFGPGTLVDVSHGCYGTAQFIPDGGRVPKRLHLRSCFNRLYLRRIDQLPEGGPRDDSER